MIGQWFQGCVHSENKRTTTGSLSLAASHTSDRWQRCDPGGTIPKTQSYDLRRNALTTSLQEHPQSTKNLNPMVDGWWFTATLCRRFAKWAERPPKVMKRSQRWNNLQICPRRDSISGGSDLWENYITYGTLDEIPWTDRLEALFQIVVLICQLPYNRKMSWLFQQAHTHAHAPPPTNYTSAYTQCKQFDRECDPEGNQWLISIRASQRGFL